MSQRDLSLDGLRVFAALGVVCVHVAGNVVLHDPTPHRVDWWIGNAFGAMTHWCVPVFFMISGALLLPRAAVQPLADFYGKRFTRLLVPTIFWTVVWWALTVRSGAPISVIWKFLILGNTHLWFLYMLVGLYAATPFLGRFAMAATPRQLLVATALLLATGSLDSLLTALQDPQRLYSMSQWPFYAGYYLAGHYLYSQRSGPRTYGKWLGLSLSAGAALALMTGLLLPALGSASIEVMYCYLNPLVIVMSCGIFIAARQSSLADAGSRPMLTACLNIVAPCTLGIYVIHPMAQMVTTKFGLTGFTINPLVGISLTTLAVYVLSFAAVYALSRLPYLRRVVQ